MSKQKIVALLLLGFIEVVFVLVLLPDRWTAPLVQAVDRVTAPSYDHSRVTHPDLQGEMDRSPEVRMLERAIIGVCVLLLAANTFALVRVWRGRRTAT